MAREITDLSAGCVQVCDGVEGHQPNSPQLEGLYVTRSYRRYPTVTLSATPSRPISKVTNSPKIIIWIFMGW